MPRSPSRSRPWARQRLAPIVTRVASAGGRSSRALPTFQQLGFEDVQHLRAGYKGWVKAGKPTEK